MKTSIGTTTNFTYQGFYANVQKSQEMLDRIPLAFNFTVHFTNHFSCVPHVTKIYIQL